MSFPAQSQIYSDTTGKEIEITNFDDNPDLFPQVFMSIGLFTDNVYINNGKFIQTRKFLNLNYYNPEKKIMIQSLLGPLNGSIDGNYFVATGDKVKQKGIRIKQEGGTGYHISRPVRIRNTFGPNILLGIESQRIPSEKPLGDPYRGFINYGAGVSFLMHSHVKMNVDKNPVTSVRYLFRTSLDFIISSPFIHPENAAQDWYSYGGRFLIDGRLNSIKVGKTALVLHYTFGLYATTKGGASVESGLIEKTSHLSPIYGVGLGWHFK